ncbi:hypothetical protein [Zavarzinia sp. CC-PAN008]|uniref:hypothetical protein n=1 Tax=Zavarzinia sp. CC-PAN008 TaxID=3243332 RepID=UPI003F746C18
MMRRAILALGLVAGLAGPAAAADLALQGLRLGMGEQTGEIDALYEGVYRQALRDSVGLAAPYHRIQSNFRDGRHLVLHFSSAATGHKLFWVELVRAWPEGQEKDTADNLVRQLEGQFGPAAQKVDDRQEGRAFGSLALVWTAEDSAPLPDGFALTTDDLNKLFDQSFQERVAMFGPGFKGLIVQVGIADGKVRALRQELVDLKLGASVLVPGP